jgi:hypothetical protein
MLVSILFVVSNNSLLANFDNRVYIQKMKDIKQKASSISSLNTKNSVNEKKSKKKKGHKLNNDIKGLK